MTEKAHVVSNIPKYAGEGLHLPVPADNLLPYVYFRGQNIDKIQITFSNQKKNAHTPPVPSAAMLTEQHQATAGE